MTDFPTSTQAQLILRVQLLIARAAQSDSLKWWDDNALTTGGEYLLDKLFPSAPHEIGVKLALESARARHFAAFAEERRVLHLFALDTNGAADVELKEQLPVILTFQSEPITTMDVFREKLNVLLGELGKPPSMDETTENRLRLHFKQDSLTLTTFERFQWLAWAYGHAKPGVPVFPFFKYQV